MAAVVRTRESASGIARRHPEDGGDPIEVDDPSHVGGFTHYATGFVTLIERAIQATVD